MNRLFSVPKIGVFIDSYAPGVEKRAGEEVTVLKVKCRVQPFDAKLATALDEGVGGDSNIRRTVFSLNTGDPIPHFTAHEFKLGTLPRQTLELFASPDTPGSRMAFSQAKITGCKVRGEKDSNALAFTFSATFGPVGKDELEMVHSLHRMQTFVTFHEGEPLLEEKDADDAEGTDADIKAQRPAPMWEDDGTGSGKPAEADASEEGPTTREIGSRRTLHSHQVKARGRRKKRDDDAVGEDATVN